MRNSNKQAEQYIQFIRNSVLRHYNTDYRTFIKQPQTTIFYKALKVQPATKKAICEAFNLNIESMCRRKRKFEIQGRLQESRKKAICKYTGKRASLLTTDRNLFNTKYYGYGGRY